jgi:Tfp pilus assembly protein PilO
VSGRRFKFDIRQASRPILLVLALWLVGAAVFYFVFTRPEVEAYHTLLRDTEPQRTALDEQREAVEANEAFLEALRKAETDLLHLRREVLSTRAERLVEVERELAVLCRQFNIALDSVSYDNELMEDEGLDRMAMVVPLEGGYAALRKFLHAVESSDKFLLIEQVALGEGKEGGKSLQLDITLTTYFNLPERSDEEPAPRRRPNRRRRA